MPFIGTIKIYGITRRVKKLFLLKLTAFLPMIHPLLFGKLRNYNSIPHIIPCRCRKKRTTLNRIRVWRCMNRYYSIESSPFRINLLALTIPGSSPSVQRTLRGSVKAITATIKYNISSVFFPKPFTSQRQNTHDTDWIL